MHGAGPVVDARGELSMAVSPAGKAKGGRSRLSRHTPEVSALSRGLAACPRVAMGKPQRDSAPARMNLVGIANGASTRA